MFKPPSSGPPWFPLEDEGISPEVRRALGSGAEQWNRRMTFEALPEPVTRQNSKRIKPPHEAHEPLNNYSSTKSKEVWLMVLIPSLNRS